MMSGLFTDDNKVVLAGEYRSIAVHGGMHNYPSFECIPRSMSYIVVEYNKRSEEPHDMYQLASWLLFQIVSLHPFEDGNGRLCRLLWCNLILSHPIVHVCKPLLLVLYPCSQMIREF